MPQIINTNPCEIWPAYIPAWFDILEFTSVGDIAPALEVEFYVEGQLITRQNYPPAFVTNAGAGQQANRWRINAANVLQRAFENEATLPGFGFVSIGPAGGLKNFYIRIRSWLASDGVLFPSEEWVQSQNYKAVNAYRETDEAQCLSEYTQLLNRKWFTSKPEKTVVSLEDSEWLGIYNSGPIVMLLVKFYDAADSLINEGIIQNSAAYGEDAVFGVGPANINAATWFYGGQPIDSTVDYYTVQAYTLGFPTGVPVSEIRTYYLDQNSSTSYRIHFLNKFGYFDSFSIRSNWKEFYDSRGDTFERNLPIFSDVTIPFNQYRQTHILSKTRENGFTAYGQDLRRSDLLWLMELSNSPNIFWEKSGKYIPIYADRVKADLDDSDRNDKEIKIEFTLSNKVKSQSN